MTTWLILTCTLPSTPSGLRVRIWRALKATACAPLRDGVYLLPASAPTAADLWAIEADIREGGAAAHMLALQARDGAQEAEFRALFDRGAAYKEFGQSLKQARQSLRGGGSEQSLRQCLRTLGQSWQALRATDFFPGPASQAAEAGWSALQQEVQQQLSPGEPTARGARVEQLQASAFRGKTWATRKRPWVDRLATAWLVIRFIDAGARFAWLSTPVKCPRGAIGFDFDGARFSHEGERVTFEVVAHAFGLDGEPGLRRLGELVHFIDVGGIEVDEAAGVQTLVRGLQALHAGDDALLAASLPVFDSLHAALKAAP